MNHYGTASRSKCRALQSVIQFHKNNDWPNLHSKISLSKNLLNQPNSYTLYSIETWAYLGVRTRNHCESRAALSLATGNHSISAKGTSPHVPKSHLSPTGKVFLADSTECANNLQLSVTKLQDPMASLRLHLERQKEDPWRWRSGLGASNSFGCQFMQHSSTCKLQLLAHNVQNWGWGP